MNIVCIKLVTGDELIAQVSGTTFTGSDLLEDTAVQLDKVRAIGLQQVGQNQVGVGIMPWMVGNIDATVTLNFKKHVIAAYTPKDELEKSYLQQTSRIALA